MEGEAQIAANTARKADTYVRSMPSEPQKKQEYNAVEQAEQIIKNAPVKVSPPQPPLDTVGFEATPPRDTQNDQEVSIQIGGGQERTDIHTIEDYLRHERFQYLEKEEARINQEVLEKGTKATEALAAIQELPAHAIADVRLLDTYLTAELEVKQTEVLRWQINAQLSMLEKRLEGTAPANAQFVSDVTSWEKDAEEIAKVAHGSYQQEKRQYCEALATRYTRFAGDEVADNDERINVLKQVEKEEAKHKYIFDRLRNGASLVEISALETTLDAPPSFIPSSDEMLRERLIKTREEYLRLSSIWNNLATACSHVTNIPEAP